MSSKPIHPATVHFPIAFLILSYSLDLLHFSTTSSLLPKPSSLTHSLLPHLPTIALASHYLLILGTLTGLIAIASGVVQLLKMINNGGLYEADKKTMRPKIRIALLHAGMNDAGIAMAAYSWWVRRGGVVQGAAVAGPGFVNVLISAVSLPALIYSAALGGTLVYNYGVGLNMGKKGKAS